MIFLLNDFGGEGPASAGRNSRKSAVAVGMEFGIAERHNLVTKNACDLE